MCVRPPPKRRIEAELAAGDVSCVTINTNSAIASKGPLATLKGLQLASRSSGEQKQWIEDARLDAILGRNASTLRSLRSGIRCYISFVGVSLCRCGHLHCYVPCVLIDASSPDQKASYFPPSLETLMAWSSLFRCCDTFRNYCNYVRTACFLVKAPTEV